MLNLNDRATLAWNAAAVAGAGAAVGTAAAAAAAAPSPPVELLLPLLMPLMTPLPGLVRTKRYLLSICLCCCRRCCRSRSSLSSCCLRCSNRQLRRCNIAVSRCDCDCDCSCRSSCRPGSSFSPIIVVGELDLGPVPVSGPGSASGCCRPVAVNVSVSGIVQLCPVTSSLASAST